ncbi:MAG TPA: HEAT repeat domain-containing protein, partial [Flavisolibacter sp.]|nr:HEAT repeat domain-containing protein [Flavisolibacter sp.]
MPFQLTEIKALFEAEDQNHWMRTGDLQNSPGFVSIVSYLTGETPSIQGIPPANENYQFSLFLSLLQSPAAPSEKDKLVLNVLFHPDVFQYVRHYVFHWFTQYLMENDDEKTIQSTLALFQKAGFNATAFHEVILYNLQHFPSAADLFERNTSALKQFLLQHLPSSLIGRRHQHSFYVHGDWNYYYFLLLEEAQPHLVNDYLLQALFMGRKDLVVTLATHKNGVYKGNIIQWISLPPTSQAELYAKFQTALFLFESDNRQYQQLALDASRQFLQRYTAFAEPSHWEPGCHLQSTPDLQKGHLCYRAWAVHFLLTAEKEQAKEMVFEWFSNKVFVHFDVLFVLHHHLKDESLPYLQMALEKNTAGGADYFRKIIELLTTNFIPEQYTPTLWKLTAAKSKPVREMVARILVEKDSDAEEKAIALLGNKSADGRGTGAYILSFFSSEKAASAVRELLNTETNDNTRDLYLQIIKDGLPKHTDESIRRALVDSARQRNKLSKPVEPWLVEEDLPALHYLSGNQLSNDEVRFLLYRMSRVKGMRSDIEAKYILDAINRDTSAAFALQLLKRYTDNGAKPEHKYLMALAALLGNDDVVDKIRVSTNSWIDEGRVKMAEYGVGALALQGSNKALRWVEWYSRKYKTKKANVGTAALQALEDAAEELGITVHELGDRVVPDFGFNGLFKTFAICNEEYRAFIDSNFKLCFFNEDGKKLKALPAAADAALKEDFKALGNEVRDMVRSQSGPMQYYILMQRKSSVESWQSFFLG